MAALEEKLGGGPTDHSIVLGVVSGALFLGSGRVRPTLLMACERLLRTWTTHRKRTRGIRGLTWKRMCHVYRVFPCRVYIDSNHRDSRIYVTLVHGSLHEANLI
jgi:hypothetical protein